MRILRYRSKVRAFTIVDLIIVVTTVLLLLAVLPAFQSRHRHHSPRIKCVSNLKQIGLAFRIFANEYDEHYPFAVPNLTNEQTGVILTGNTTTAKAWMHFQALSNELQSARVLACPADARRWKNSAEDFSNTKTSLAHPKNRDAALSYFVGLYADETKSQAILAGDRNLSAVRNGNPYSSVQAGGAIQVSEKSAWSDAPRFAFHGTQGNAALADGSVIQMSTPRLQQQLAQATNSYGTNINLFLFPQ